MGVTKRRLDPPEVRRHERLDRGWPGKSGKTRGDCKGLRTVVTDEVGGVSRLEFVGVAQFGIGERMRQEGEKGPASFRYGSQCSRKS